MQGIIFPLRQEVKPIVAEKEKNKEPPQWSAQSPRPTMENKKKPLKKRSGSSCQKVLLIFLIILFSGGILAGAFLSRQNSVTASYLRQLADVYLQKQNALPVIKLYANSFFSMLLLHGAMVWASFSCIGMLPSVLLLVGKGITVGCITAQLYLSQASSLSSIIGLLPYHVLSSVLALLMTFASVKQSIRLFQKHFLHDRTIKYQASDGIYFFLAITAGSFLAALTFCLGCFLPVF